MKICFLELTLKAGMRDAFVNLNARETQRYGSLRLPGQPVLALVMF